MEDQHVLIDKFHLEKIIDLRSKDEVSKRPDKVVGQTEYLHIDIFEDINDEGAGLEDFITIGSAKRSKEYMNDIYRTMTINPSAQKGFSKFLEAAASTEQNNSFLFHCFAGKDRTGISCALLLEILEIPKETIYQDYLLTNKLRVQENQEIIQSGKENGAAGGMLEALQIALTVDSEFLDTFYQTVDAEFGGINNYLKNNLNVSDSMKKELRQLIITD